jgi:hypothetical protein
LCFVSHVFLEMKWAFSVTLGFVALVSAQNDSSTNRQPTVSAPHGNSWKVLSKDEAEGVNRLLADGMGLTGDFGSSQDSYV